MKAIARYLSLALFGLSAVAAIAQPDAKAATPGPEDFVGKAFPTFSMTDVAGNVWTNERLKGKVLLVDFWATWCGPCRKASPVMQALHDKYASQGLVVIGANCSERLADGKPNLSREPARDYAATNKLTYLFTFNNNDLKKAVNIKGIPTMFVVDRSGTVQYVQVGFNEKLEAILAKPIEAALGR